MKFILIWTIEIIFLIWTILIYKKIDSAQCSSGRPTFKEYLLKDGLFFITTWRLLRGIYECDPDILEEHNTVKNPF